MDTDNNKINIQKEIFMKNSTNPYIVGKSIYNSQNNMDIFPYPKWFQSVPTDDVAYVAEREAGWCPKNINFIKRNYVQKVPLRNPNLCFQAPCSVVYPCYSQDTSYINLNRACINEYR
jgi:hypothetical protein